MARNRRNEQADIRQEELRLLRQFMSTPIGRAYIFNLLTECHMFSTSFTPNAMRMAFNEGERNMAIMLSWSLNEASPDLYMQMMKEGGNYGQSIGRNGDRRDRSGSDDFDATNGDGDDANA